mmetsp:Transcript_38784/g.62804  ORF Transcript_38784/g.62804 Transcript_38784/m.62804 type:complete len:128 (+) Transcript_38784:123-506(+)
MGRLVCEIDSLLSMRSDGENEGSRRIKTEFLVQMDGVNGHQDDPVIVVGATNRPHDLDEAARRRLSKKLYIQLPDAEGRRQIVMNFLKKEEGKHNMTEEDQQEIVRRTEGYSGADMQGLLKEAAMGD